MLRFNKELVKYPFYLIVHPFNGFWDLKYEQSKKVNLIISCIILITLSLTNILAAQYSGFVVSIPYPDGFNSIMEIVYVVVPVLFWSIANWSLTTLMDGEGKFSEIFNSTCFALLPIVILNLPWIGLSNLISLEETAFYYFTTSFSLIWFLFLLFVGNMTVHQFTPSKTIVTMLLSVIAMGFMAFLCMLFFSLVQQIIAFVSVIYQEIVLRS